MSGKWSPDQHARYAETIRARREAAGADPSKLRRNPVPAVPQTSYVSHACHSEVVALTEAVAAIRSTVLRVEDRLHMLIGAAGLIPTPAAPSPAKDPDLVDAFRILHLRLMKLERSGLTSGDWEEHVDEILQTVRSMDRKLTRMAPAAPRKRRRRTPEEMSSAAAG